MSFLTDDDGVYEPSQDSDLFEPTSAYDLREVRQSAIPAQHEIALLFCSGGALNSQTSDTQYIEGLYSDGTNYYGLPAPPATLHDVELRRELHLPEEGPKKMFRSVAIQTEVEGGVGKSCEGPGWCSCRCHEKADGEDSDMPQQLNSGYSAATGPQHECDDDLQVKAEGKSPSAASYSPDMSDKSKLPQVKQWAWADSSSEAEDGRLEDHKSVSSTGSQSVSESSAASSRYMVLADEVTGRMVCLDTHEQSQLEVSIDPCPRVPALNLDLSTQDQRYWGRFRERHNGTDVEYYLADSDDASDSEDLDTKRSHKRACIG
ncbi:hypothetical protein PHLGIDRAFT_123454 [Phlebiopsis gigantea 11061_1 CR5-6]|uniref:Uncharacterized protein n=1 Tax=Phlebiopsis gigantea (strain 11061_1 CR5-6) TaxID=745531 RepID=A0A0C3P9I2_PHLG1|nr:hypothetical protein PHLGIDRAFT_123454 [Phlebiopsis gigantea 11061_1 CR5-6]